MSTVISSLGNVGPGLGAFGPAFSWAALPDAAKWVLSFLMLIGRLELFAVLLLFLFRILGKMIVLREKLICII